MLDRIFAAHPHLAQVQDAYEWDLVLLDTTIHAIIRPKVGPHPTHPLSSECWCQPETYEVCPECLGHSLEERAECQACDGLGAVRCTTDPRHYPVIVVHVPV